MTRYKHHFKIYTDGSKLSNNNGATSTTAGYYVEGRNNEENDILNIRHYWKLHPDITIVGAELSALKKATDWLILETANDDQIADQYNSITEEYDGLLYPDKVVILTDSKVSLQLLKNKKPKSYISSVTDIHKNIIRLKFLGWDISFQWIPSHCGLEGNEIADNIAGFGHNHNIIDNYPTELNEVLTSLKKTYSRKWSELWDVDKQTCPLGRYKHTLEPWPHTRHHKRALDVIMTRF